MKAIVWNKQDAINGISAYEVIHSHNIKESDEIFLVMNGGRVTELQFKDIIASNYNLDINMTVEQVAQKYVELREQEALKIQQEEQNKVSQQEQIDALKQENADITYALMQNNLI